jgi:hypothetical protein
LKGEYSEYLVVTIHGQNDDVWDDIALVYDGAEDVTRVQSTSSSISLTNPISWHQAPSITSNIPRNGQLPIANCLARTPAMLARTLRARSAARGLAVFRAYSTPATSVNQAPANDAAKRRSPPNVSETNATPTSSEGSFDKVLQESVAKGEELRTTQAPNYKGTWSTSQQARAVAMQGPRFEQTIMEDQVCQLPPSLPIGAELRPCGQNPGNERAMRRAARHAPPSTPLT